MVGCKLVYQLLGILILTSLSFSAAAKTSRAQIFPFPDQDLGVMTVTVEDESHPVLLPYRLKVFVTCKNRLQREVLFEVPEYGVPAKGEGAKVCQFPGNGYVVKPSYDREKKTLNVEYYISTTMEGEGKCDTKIEQPFYLDQICANPR